MISSKITVVLRNDSVQFVHEEPPSTNVSCGFLLIVMAVGLCLNASVLFSIVVTPLREAVFNRLIACLSLAAAFEDVANVTASAIIRSSWEDLHGEYGELSLGLFCALDAASKQFAAVMQSCILALLTYERSTSLRNGRGAVKFETVSRLFFLVPIVAAVPVGFFPSKYMEQRYGCSPAHVSRPVQTLTAFLTILLGYCFPSCLMLASCLVIIKEILKERRRIHILEMMARQRSPPRTALNMEDLREMSLYILPGALMLFYVVLVLPNVISVQTTQFYSSYRLKKEPASLFEEFVTNKTELPEGLRAVELNSAESLYIWARYSFTLVSPCLILLFHEDVRKICGSWWRIPDDGREFRTGQSRKTKGGEEADPNTPVLFASSAGLHLRARRTRSKRLGKPEFAVTFCDSFREEKAIKRESTNSGENGTITVTSEPSHYSHPPVKKNGFADLTKEIKET